MKLSAEDRILNSARKVFLLNGFHGATIRKIAEGADVSKTSIHYYFRSKMKLFEIIVPGIIDEFTRNETDREIRLQITIFFLAEMNNNQEQFTQILINASRYEWFQRWHNELLRVL